MGNTWDLKIWENLRNTDMSESLPLVKRLLAHNIYTMFFTIVSEGKRLLSMTTFHPQRQTDGGATGGAQEPSPTPVI